MVAETAFQIGLFFGIMMLGWSIGLLLESANVPAARLISLAITIPLLMNVLLKWTRLFDYFWPKQQK